MSYFIEQFIVFLFMVGATALSVIAEALFGGIQGF